MEAKEQLLGTGRWLSLHNRPYIDPTGKSRVRGSVLKGVNHRSGGNSASALPGVVTLMIYGVINTTGKPDEMLIVRQFRPPLMKDILELPAGLVDEGESCAKAALRELKEETGYSGVVEFESEIVTADPGLTDATFRMVHVKIDGNAPENQNPKQHLEGCEFITVLRIPVVGMLEALRAQPDCMIDGKLLNFAYGLRMGNTYSRAT